jgi:hypothetical protein
VTGPEVAETVEPLVDLAQASRLEGVYHRAA